MILKGQLTFKISIFHYPYKEHFSSHSKGFTLQPLCFITSLHFLRRSYLPNRPVHIWDWSCITQPIARLGKHGLINQVDYCYLGTAYCRCWSNWSQIRKSYPWFKLCCSIGPRCSTAYSSALSPSENIWKWKILEQRPWAAAAVVVISSENGKTFLFQNYSSSYAQFKQCKQASPQLTGNVMLALLQNESKLSKNMVVPVWIKYCLID